MPHSGNDCSGLCATPCDHEGCWQCEKEKEVARLKAINALKRRVTNAVSPMVGITGSLQNGSAPVMSAREAKRQIEDGLMSGLPVQAKDWQVGTITRSTLEDLCKRAGVAMNWNNGNPQFPTYSALAAKAAEDLSSATAKTMDEMVKNILSKKIEENLRAPLFPGLKSPPTSPQEAIRQSLRDRGEKDEDIAAAEKLFGWKDPKATLPVEGTPPDEVSPLSAEMITDYIKRLDAGLIAVSGLNDVLLGASPDPGWKVQYGQYVLSGKAEEL